MNPEVFYLHIDGEQRGPYTVSQIDHLVNSGLVPEHAMYWREGLEDYLPVTDLVAVRKPKNQWLKRAIVAAAILVLAILARVFGPITLEGWRENAQYEFSQRAAYWRARDFVRQEALPSGTVITFGAQKMARITLDEAKQAATVWLPAEVSTAGAYRPRAWEVHLQFNPKAKQWSRVSVAEATL